jgi:hypothetical protein
VQTISAVMPVGFIITLLIWQSRLCETGAPYLSIMAWVRQTCTVCGALMAARAAAGIPGGKGDCWYVMLLVISQRPGFLTACAKATIATANRQQLKVIQTAVLRMIPPDELRGADSWPRGSTLL